MPPFVPRKRQRSASPAAPPPTKGKATEKPAKKCGKQTLFEAADTPPKNQARSAEETKRFIELADEDDEDDSASDLDSDDFEDVKDAPPAKKRKTAAPGKKAKRDESDGDEMDWEDAIGEGPSSRKPTATIQEPEIGDISVSLNDDGSYVDTLTAMAAGKKGPSKRERQARYLTHCLHVQTLMWHHTVRNSWLNGKEAQSALVDGLTEGVKREVTRYREAMGMLSKEELEAKKKQTAANGKGKGKMKAKDKGKGRDWNYDAEHLEQGMPNLSRGDPLLRLLKVLTAYWRKRFTITAPGLRKQGYMPLKRLRDEIKDWGKNREDHDQHGERIENVKAFREMAVRCKGSRDVGNQLFVALLRGLGMDARLVANLQPAGLGWSKAEEAKPKRSKKEQKADAEAVSSDDENEAPAKRKASAKKKTPAKKKNASAEDRSARRKSGRGDKAQPIDLDASDSPLSEPPSQDEEALEDDEDDDDLSVIDVTPSMPKKRLNKKYDLDLAFPIYWAEVYSPVSHKYIPVDPMVLSTIASKDELLETFEPRGKKAELSKQVMCYTIAYSADGSAKDVTIRYLKKHQLPGKTKGMRMAAEKIPIYNSRGKVKKYEDYDWFRTVMSVYDRPYAKRTAADDLEDQTDLKPFKPAKAGKDVEKESLQWYKSSADFALEQHLRREEAIVPGAKPVKMFTAGKGEKAKDHPVFRREDVVTCKTVESWHKEGRAIKHGEQPVKHVPIRAVTLIRKREVEDAQRETGSKPTQGLYSLSQTDWIIPPPIENGRIPKNAFGNMDCYVPTMVPRGAVHLPLRGTVKICKKLGIDFAEACTGFEFGKQRAVPILTGVVVADENAGMVRDAWREAQIENKRKEDTKRTATALHWWKKMLMGMRIVERMKAEYDQVGDGEGEFNPFVSKAKREGRGTARDPVGVDDDEGMGGGFSPPGHDEEEVSQRRAGPAKKLDDDEDVEMGGGFLVEENPEEVTGKTSKAYAPITPVSLQSLHQNDSASDGSEEGEPTAAPPAKRMAAKAASKPKATAVKPAGRSTGKRKAAAPTPSESEEDDDDDASSLSDLDEEFAQEDSEDDVVVRKPAAKKSHASPRVVITPQHRKAPASGSRGGRAAKKVMPVRSQYFFAADDEGEGVDEGEDEDDGGETDAEVVQPRRTTKRTRSDA